MTYEKALEAMRQGKKIRRKFWDKNVCIGIDSANIIRNMTYDDIFHSYEYCMPTDLMSRDILMDDWEIHEPNKEKTIMYKSIEITFKSGNTIAYKEGEWDDYSYDGESIAVKKNGAWIGIYNFDNVFCVELKQ